MALFDVHIRSGSSGETTVLKASAGNPDDAIYRLVIAGYYIPEAGDVVTRCVDLGRQAKRTDL